MLKSRYRIVLFFFFAAWLGLFGCQPAATPPDIQAAIKRLQAPQASIRWTAASALGKNGLRALPAASALSKALADPHWLVRGHAAFALLRIGPKAAPAFVAALNKVNLRYRFDGDSAFARVARGLSKQVVPLLRARAIKEPGRARSWALSALTLLGPPACPILLSLLKHKENDLRASVLRAFRDLGPLALPAKDAIIRALDDHAGYVRRQAAETLETLGPLSPKLQAKLEKMVAQDSDIRARLSAARTLAAHKAISPKAVRALLEIARSPQALTFFRYQAIGPLGPLTHALPPNQKKLTRAVVKHLTQLLQHRLASLRIGALKALKAIGPPAQDAALTLLTMNPPRPHLKHLLHQTLRSIMPLSQALRLTHSKLSKHRAIGLSLLRRYAKHPVILPALGRALQDKNSEVRLAALQTLQHLPISAQRTLSPPLWHLAIHDPQATSRALAIRLLSSQQVAGKTPDQSHPSPARKASDQSHPKPTSQPSQPNTKHTPASQPSSMRTAPTSRSNASPKGRENTHWFGLLRAALKGPQPVQIAAIHALAKQARNTPLARRLLFGTFQPQVPYALKRASLEAWVQHKLMLPATLFSEVWKLAQRDSPLEAQAVAALGLKLQDATPKRQLQIASHLLTLLRSQEPKAPIAEAAQSLSAWEQRWKKGQTRRLWVFLQTAMLGLLKHHAPAIRTHALRALQTMSAETRRALQKPLQAIVLSDPNPRCRILAAEALAPLPPKPHDAAFWGRALYDQEAGVRLAALQALQADKAHAHTAFPALLTLLWARETQTESRVIALLGALGPAAQRATYLLQQRLRHATSWLTRAHAARSLGQIGYSSPTIIAALQRATHDPHPKVRASARTALSQLRKGP